LLSGNRFLDGIDIGWTVIGLDWLIVLALTGEGGFGRGEAPFFR
jgi:hypothetical protein